MREMPRAGERATHRRTDPAYAPNVEVFDNLTHTEIHAKVQLLNPAVLAGGRQAWADAAAQLSDAIFQAHNGIRAAIADGWRGSAAKSADAVVRVFEQNGQDLADVFAVVSQRLGQAGDAAEALRAAVTEPSADTPDLPGALLDPSRATSNVEGQKASEHARQDVVRAMNDIYAGVFVPTGTDVPAFPDETDQPQTPAPTATPASKVTGAAEIAAPDAQPTPHGTTFHEPSRTAGQNGSATPAEQTSAPDASSTSAAAVASTAATGEAPATTAPRVAPAAAPSLPTDTAASVLRTAPAAPAATTAATAPASVAAEAASVPTVPGVGSQVTPEEQRKRDERRKTEDNGDAAVTGLGAGAVGGLMGGALAAADSPRTGASVAANAATARPAAFDDEDDEYDLDDLPTFLEPSDDGGELIGSLDPTTPPVLGEWTEYE
ncbi:WXG100 family type VII secretion target [Nocardia asteroides]